MRRNEVEVRCCSCGTTTEAKRGDQPLMCSFCDAKVTFDWSQVPPFINFVELVEVSGPRWFL
jgi:NMD protein affecting ribosome stability and mRNA decay